MLNSIIGETLTFSTLMLCTLSSLLLGLGSAGIFMYKNRYTSSFVVTLVLLPAIVQLVIMLVNGNVGAGVAVLGAFSLVRFRSIAGEAREIASIFLVMALGIATGMGYIGLAGFSFLVIGAAMCLLSALRFGEPKNTEKELKITIPENLDYEGVFDDIFDRYTTRAELYRIKTTSMGALYELSYHITLRGQTVHKEFLDELRTRNGNLNIVCGRRATGEAL